MNKIIIHILVIAAIALSLASCSTSQKISIYGTPGENIYTTDLHHVGTIPASGMLKIKTPDSNYEAFMLSTKPGEKTLIPFGLNYKNASHTGTRVAKYAGIAVAGAGVGTALIGAICMIAASSQDDEDNTSLFGTVTAVGAAVGGLGVSFGMPADYRCGQEAYEFKYKYLPSQETNGNFVFTVPDIKYVTIEESKPVEQPKLRPRQQNKQSNTAKATAPQKARKTLVDFAKKAEGEYVGTGVIMLDGEEIEVVNGLTVKIVRSGSNEVAVNIIESDGNDFFGAPAKYKAAKGDKKNGKSSINLTHFTIPTALITIKDEELVYLNPLVEIDGTIYHFNITAEKQ